MSTKPSTKLNLTTSENVPVKRRASRKKVQVVQANTNPWNALLPVVMETVTKIGNAADAVANWANKKSKKKK